MRRASSDRRTSGGQMDYDRPSWIGGALWALVAVVGVLLAVVAALVAWKHMRG